MLSIIIAVTSANGVAYVDAKVARGRVRVHYPTEAGSSECEVFLLSVGTTMSANSYDILSGEMVAYGYMVAVIDNVPGWPFKLNFKRLADIVNELQNDILNIANGTVCSSISHWILGGHSAGGQVALQAISNGLVSVNAAWGLDPFDSTKAKQIDLPAFYWGFTETTCFVTKSKAALAAFYITEQNKRALYQVTTNKNLFHCRFCDSNCFGCTNSQPPMMQFLKAVAQSAHYFVQAAFYGTWEKESLIVNGDPSVALNITLYTNSDNQQ